VGRAVKRREARAKTRSRCEGPGSRRSARGCEQQFDRETVMLVIAPRGGEPQSIIPVFALPLDHPPARMMTCNGSVLNAVGNWTAVGELARVAGTNSGQDPNYLFE
jgi:hypothetical protein